MMVSTSQLAEWLGTAQEVVQTARQVTLAKMAQGFQTWTKTDASYVTEVDLAVEQTLQEGLMRHFPTHGLLGEEFGAVHPASEFQWMIDPIDGTLSFTRGIPLFGTIVALHFQGQPLLGIIDHPALGWCYSAAKGLGTFCNGQRLQIAEQQPLREITQEIISLSDRPQFVRSNCEHIFDTLMHTHPYVRIYSDCFGHTLVLKGALGAAVDFGLRLWDIAATQILVEEAGGKYICWEDADEAGPRFGVICGKPQVVDWLVELIAREDPL